MPRNRKDHDRALSSCHGARLVVLSSELLKVLRSILIPTLLSFNPIAPFGTPQQVFYPHAPRGSGEPRCGPSGRFVAEPDISGTSRPSRDRPFGRYTLALNDDARPLDRQRS